MISHGLLDRRISARSVPMKMPPTIAITVSCSENAKPLATKLWTTPQLRKAKSRFNTSLASDHAGHAHTALDGVRDAVDGEGRDEIQPGDGEVDLDAARGFLLRLHRKHRQLRDAHREGDRRVLDDAHRLRRERLDDDAQLHRQP